MNSEAKKSYLNWLKINCQSLSWHAKMHIYRPIEDLSKHFRNGDVEAYNDGRAHLKNENHINLNLVQGWSKRVHNEQVQDLSTTVEDLKLVLTKNYTEEGMREHFIRTSDLRLRPLMTKIKSKKTTKIKSKNKSKKKRRK